MSNVTACCDPATTRELDEILTLARDAGMLITLDGQIGREKYQSIEGSLTSFKRFADALRTSITTPRAT